MRTLRNLFVLVMAGIVVGTAAPLYAQETAPKPATPAFSPLHTAAEGKGFKVTVIERDADKDDKLTDEASFDLTVSKEAMARMDRTRLDYSDATPTIPPALENPSLSVFDGKTTVEYDADNHKYLRLPVASDATPRSLVMPLRTLWFAARGWSEKTIVPAADETLDGKNVLVENVDVTKEGAAHPIQRQRYVIDADTHLLRRLEIIVWQGDTPRVVTQYDFSGWKLDPTISGTYFDWIPSSEAMDVTPKDILPAVAPK